MILKYITMYFWICIYRVVVQDIVVSWKYNLDLFLVDGFYVLIGTASNKKLQTLLQKKCFYML